MSGPRATQNSVASLSKNFVNREGAEAGGVSVSFSFGENWWKYLKSLNSERIRQAMDSLERSFGGDSLKHQRFIDVGCGSGLFSCAAVALGAEEVLSFDIDPNSVLATTALRSSVANPSRWSIMRGSILDRRFIGSLSPGTRVFSWGVLHHTGAMWQAIDNVLDLVAPGGILLLALYNRPRHPSRDLAIKKAYNRLPKLMKPLARACYGTAVLSAGLLIKGRNPIRHVRDYGKNARGMSFWRDAEDWLGGLPYEFAETEAIRVFVEARGFALRDVLERGKGANNEYLFERKT